MNNFWKFLKNAPYLYLSLALLVVAVLSNQFIRNQGIGVAAHYSLGATSASATSGVTVTKGLITSYSPTSCPNLPFANSESLNLPSSQIKVRKIAPVITTQSVKGKKKSVAKSNSATLAIAKSQNLNLSQPILIAPSATTSTFQVNGSGWSDIGYCANGNPSEWFLGGSGELTSQGQIDLVNSGLTPATISIITYNSKGTINQITRTIAANNQSTFSISGLIPADPSPAVQIVTEDGQVTPYLVDVRQKGLSSLGGALIPMSEDPNTNLMIPGIEIANNSKAFLRVLVPGNVDGNISASVISANGNFIPVGLNSLLIPHQKVVDVPLSNFTATDPIALAISSDQPVLATLGAVAPNGALSWFSSAPALQSQTIALGNLTTNLVLAANPNLPGSNKNNQVRITFAGKGGKTTRVVAESITVNGFTNIKAPFPLTQISISLPNNSTNLYGALLFPNFSATRTLVLRPGAQLLSVRAPTPDARILSRG